MALQTRCIYPIKRLPLMFVVRKNSPRAILNSILENSYFQNVCMSYKQTSLHACCVIWKSIYMVWESIYPTEWIRQSFLKSSNCCCCWLLSCFWVKVHGIWVQQKIKETTILQTVQYNSLKQFFPLFSAYPVGLFSQR